MKKNMPISHLKKSIMEQRGIAQFEPKTKKPLKPSQLPTLFNKTLAMQLLELKFNKPITDIVYDGNIYQVEAKYGVDATTVSKWRKLMRRIE